MEPVLASKLWTPGSAPTLLGPRKYVSKERIVTLSTGERVRVWTDDSGTVTQIEHNDTLDAVVRPKTIHVKYNRAERGR